MHLCPFTHSVTLPAPQWPNGGMAVSTVDTDNNPVMHKIYFEGQLSFITWYELFLVFNFRSFMGLRTRWERTTGGASQISSPCH